MEMVQAIENFIAAAQTGAEFAVAIAFISGCTYIFLPAALAAIKIGRK